MTPTNYFSSQTLMTNTEDHLRNNLKLEKQKLFHTSVCVCVCVCTLMSACVCARASVGVVAQAWGCVCAHVALLIQHVMRCLIVIYGLYVSTTFFDIFSQKTRSSEKDIEHYMYFHFMYKF
jgi:hypothetical protein